MPDERSETAGGPGGGDAAADATPGRVSGADEEAAAEQDATAVPIGVPAPPESWRELKRRADEPGDTSPDQDASPQQDSSPEQRDDSPD
jgi:hypothetical protein